MLIGYARISTEYQTFDSQIAALKSFGIDERQIYKETISGGTQRRKILEDTIEYLKKGDTLVVFKLDRLGRSVADLISIMNRLDQKGIVFHSITEKLETKSAAGKLLFHMMATLAEFERNIISERVKAGMDAAKAKGARFGRREIFCDSQKEHVRGLLKQGRNKYDIKRIMGLKSRSPIYKLIKDDLAKEKGEVNIAPSLEFKGLN